MTPRISHETLALKKTDAAIHCHGDNVMCGDIIYGPLLLCFFSRGVRYVHKREVGLFWSLYRVIFSKNDFRLFVDHALSGISNLMIDINIYIK